MYGQHTHGAYSKFTRVVVRDGIEYLQHICGEDAEIYFEEIIKPETPQNNAMGQDL